MAHGRDHLRTSVALGAMKNILKQLLILSTSGMTNSWNGTAAGMRNTSRLKRSTKHCLALDGADQHVRGSQCPTANHLPLAFAKYWHGEAALLKRRCSAPSSSCSMGI